jgi:hypothetical protein
VAEVDQVVEVAQDLPTIFVEHLLATAQEELDTVVVMLLEVLIPETVVVLIPVEVQVQVVLA